MTNRAKFLIGNCYNSINSFLNNALIQSTYKDISNMLFTIGSVKRILIHQLRYTLDSFNVIIVVHADD